MNTTTQEKTVKELFLGKCWEYLNDNFHKFTEPNKIKIALALAQKDLPQEVKGLQQQIVVMQEIKKNQQELRYNIGNPDSTQDTQYPEQASTTD